MRLRYRIAPKHRTKMTMPMASEPPRSVGGDQLRAAQKLMNDAAVDAMGFKALFFTLKLERCFTREDLQALLPEFTRLMATLTAGRGETDYAALAAESGSTEGAVRVAVHRMRKRFRLLIREEVGRTVTSDEDVDAEMAELMRALGG